MSILHSLGAPPAIQHATMILNACQECGAEQHQTPDPADPRVLRVVVAHEPDCTTQVSTKRVIPW
jgi:hypothetical protein